MQVLRWLLVGSAGALAATALAGVISGDVEDFNRPLEIAIGASLLVSALAMSVSRPALSRLVGAGLLLVIMMGALGFHSAAALGDDEPRHCGCLAVIGPKPHAWYLVLCSPIAVGAAIYLSRESGVRGNRLVGVACLIPAAIGVWLSAGSVLPESANSDDRAFVEGVVPGLESGGSGSLTSSDPAPPSGSSTVTAGGIQSAILRIQLLGLGEEESQTATIGLTNRRANELVASREERVASSRAELEFEATDLSLSPGALRACDAVSVELPGRPATVGVIDWRSASGIHHRGTVQLELGLSSGSFGIQGRIETPQGRPVAGLEVVVSDRPHALEVHSRKTRALWNHRGTRTAVARSDAQGRFSVVGWPSEEAFIRVLTPGWVRVADGDVSESQTAAVEALPVSLDRVDLDDVGRVAAERTLRVGRILVLAAQPLPPRGIEPQGKGAWIDYFDLDVRDVVPPQLQSVALPWTSAGFMPLPLANGVRVIAQRVSLEPDRVPLRDRRAALGVLRYPGCDELTFDLTWQYVDDMRVPAIRPLPRVEGPGARVEIELVGVPFEIPAGEDMQVWSTLTDLDAPVPEEAPSWKRAGLFRDGALALNEALPAGRYRLECGLFAAPLEFDVTGQRTLRLRARAASIGALVVSWTQRGDAGGPRLDLRVEVGPAEKGGASSDGGRRRLEDMVFGLNCPAQLRRRQQAIIWLVQDREQWVQVRAQRGNGEVKHAVVALEAGRTTRVEFGQD